MEASGFHVKNLYFNNSLIFCAITMKHYVEANISRKSSTTIKYALKVVR